jgi:hypothetical protein
MEILLGLLGITCALTIPIFYIWGMVSFFRNLGGGNKSKPRTTDESDTYNLIRKMRAAAVNDPALSLEDFLRRQGIPGPWDDDAPASDAYTEAVADEAATTADWWGERATAPAPTDDDRYPYPDRASAQAEREARGESEPGFSWSNWYQENTVNLLLYVGAFLIVAAVSLFVGFQWQNLGGVVRFGIVLVFTLGWYAGGLIVQRTLKLESVGVAFITLGALLTPFCGVAWQQFVVGGAEGLGITWLVTSLISTVVYIGLSFVYRRRYFTYFGSLSILAMILALVEINDAPAEYFILTAVLSALVLLLVRVSLRFAPEEVREFYEKDFEYASLGTLVLSVFVGILAIFERDIPFYSVEVLAVVVVTAVYAWVYASVRLHAITLAVAQVITLFGVNHALVTFAVPLTPRVLLGGGVHFGLLVLLNLWLARREDRTLLRQFNRLSVGITALYAFGGFSTEDALLVFVFTALLAAHAAYVAYTYSTAWMYHITAAVAFLAVASLLDWVNAPDDAWLPVFVVLAGVETFLAYSPLPRPARTAAARVGMIALGLCLLGGVAYMDGGDAPFIGTIVSYGALLLYAAFAYTELITHERTVWRWWHAMSALVAVAVYGTAWVFTFAPFFYAGYLALVMALAALAYAHTGFPLLVSVAVIAPYMALYHLLDGMDAPDPVYPVVFALLSVGLYLLDRVLVQLPAESNRPRKYTVLGVLATVAGVAYSTASIGDSQLEYVSGWLAGYTLLGLLVYERDLLVPRSRDYWISAVALPLYFWHIEYLSRFVNADLFSEPQWYTAAVGTVALMLAWRERERQIEGIVVNMLLVLGALFFFFPTLGQIGDTGLLVYFLLGIAYALGFVAYGVTLDMPLARQIGVVALVLVVLVQARDFFLNIPRWFVVGLVGFGLIGTAVYLSVRRRDGTKQGES